MKVASAIARRTSLTSSLRVFVNVVVWVVSASMAVVSMTTSSAGGDGGGEAFVDESRKASICAGITLGDLI
jgi:hypothetical protein